MSGDAIKAIQLWLESWWAYADFCLNADLQAPVCRAFWTWISIALVALGTLLVLWVAAKIISYRRKLAAALKAQAERGE